MEKTFSMKSYKIEQYNLFKPESPLGLFFPFSLAMPTLKEFVYGGWEAGVVFFVHLQPLVHPKQLGALFLQLALETVDAVLSSAVLFLHLPCPRGWEKDQGEE